MKREHRVLWRSLYVVLVVVAAAPFLFQVFAANAVDAARAAATSKGQREQDLELLAFKESNTPLGGSATVLFRSNAGGAPQTVEVQLERPMWAVNWRLARYSEGVVGKR